MLPPSYDRSFYPQGSPRQLGAIYRSGNRTEKLAAVEAPTLVIHGKDDTLIPPSGGIRTAELIPNANLLLRRRTWATTSPNRCGRRSSTPSSPTSRNAS